MNNINYITEKYIGEKDINDYHQIESALIKWNEFDEYFRYVSVRVTDKELKKKIMKIETEMRKLEKQLRDLV